MAEQISKSARNLIIIVAASLAGTAGLYFATRWLVTYVTEVSASLESNFLYFLGWILLLLGVSFAEAFIVRAVHRLMSRGEEARTPMGREEVALEIKRQIKETKVVWTVYVAVPVIANLFIMNYASGGFIFSGQGTFSKVATISTMLRSGDKEVRREGIEMAVTSEDRKVGVYLARIIEERGELSTVAAWAAGMRHDEAARGALRKLYIKGNEKQRGNAIIALSEMKDYEIMARAKEDLAAGKGPKMNIIIALGNLGYIDALDVIVGVAGDEKQPEPARAAAFWTISKIEQERFRQTWMADSAMAGYDSRTWKSPERQGWQPLVAALKGSSPVLQCGAIQALRYAGPISTSKDLTGLFDASDRLAKCPRLALEPYKMKVFEVVSPGLLRTQILKALSGIGDRSITGWLDGVVSDRKNADEVILIAKDLARQIRNIK